MWKTAGTSFDISVTAQDANDPGGRYLGVATCAGSTCHGRAEGNGAVVRQDEIATWQEASSPTGAHSRALTVLLPEPMPPVRPIRVMNPR